MRRLIIALWLFALAVPALAAPPRPHGANCRLAAPPRAAGEIETSTTTWRVYPRTPDIGEDYAGCQTTWAPRPGGGWDVVVVMLVAHRAVMAIWPAPPDGTSPDGCRYESGRLTGGDPATCAALVKSMPHGCTARRNARGEFPAACTPR